MSGVKLSKLLKRYGDTEAVKTINLEVQPHEFVVLVGPSGCGKSTTLRTGQLNGQMKLAGCHSRISQSGVDSGA